MKQGYSKRTGNKSAAKGRKDSRPQSRVPKNSSPQKFEGEGLERSKPDAKNHKGRFSKSKSQTTHRTGRPKPDDVLWLYGFHTVLAALENVHRKKRRLFVTENALPRLEAALSGELQIPVEVRQMAELNAMVGSEAVHQGLILECEPIAALDSSELFNLADAKLLLALDQITDPHNVGAILRSAVAMGVEAVLMTSRNTAVETAVLAKSASGALDMVKTVELRNLSKGLQELNEMRFATIGLDSEGPLVLEDTLAVHSGKPICLVLGSEGAGLRAKTRETCTTLARLDMPGAIKSLNVSNAAALSLYVVASSQKS